MSTLTIKSSVPNVFNTPKSPVIQHLSDTLPKTLFGNNDLKRNYKIICSEEHIGYSTEPKIIKQRYGLCDSCKLMKNINF